MSYQTYRLLVGWLGVLLPPMLVLGCALSGGRKVLCPSISDYYDSDMRNVFVGILFAVGGFLICYRGYDWRDSACGTFGGAAMFGVALFPVTDPAHPVLVTLHYVFAAVTFFTLAMFSLWLFRKHAGNPTPRKRRRNKLYLLSGITIFACMAGIGIFKVFLHDTAVAALRPVFWLESVALAAFGVAWLCKGDFSSWLRDT